ncbi:hypothetical protein ABCS02_23815 [Microbacterium sp. X-17]|uniref:hypothetical protein n=1 Tax=Microbacterium sp. X-17 TaxID=3144404 RepID=UPI0031F5A3EC
MSTSEQQNPPLTRKQLRELRNTGATPVLPPAGEDAAALAEPVAPVGKGGKPPKPGKGAKRGPAPAVVPEPEAPVAAEGPVDLGVTPLTRRAARQQERIRTASIPVVSPDIAPAPEATAPVPPADTPVPSGDAPAPVLEPRPVEEEVDEAQALHDALFRPPMSADDAGARPLQVAAAELADEDDVDSGATVSAAFGAGFLAGTGDRSAPGASFDQLVARSGAVGGSVATPNALILSQAPASAPLVAPITATGELLVTGTFALPDGLGSLGHAPGAHDGAEADVVLIDGELPASSSPTPIAASAAISTVRDTDEIIRPPAPERGSRLMLALAITAGALALALVGVLIVAIVTGVFA